MTVNSVVPIVALENVATDKRPALRDEMIETIEQYFDESRNTVPSEYQFTEAAVNQLMLLPFDRFAELLYVYSVSY